MQDANLEDTNLQCIISIKKTIPYFGKKTLVFFYFLFLCSRLIFVNY